jgi:hypothetical protein
MTTLITGGSLLQGSFRGAPSDPGNLEAVIGRPQPDGKLSIQHYWREQSRPDRPDRVWNLGGTITTSAIGPAAIAQRRDGTSPGNFEVVVPEITHGRRGLAHYWLDNTKIGARPWNRVEGWVAVDADGPGAILENRVNGNLEAVGLTGTRLVHYWFDRSAWHAGATITDMATGAPALLQSSFADHLEVVVAEGGDLVLYWLDGFGPDARWRPGGLLTNAGDGPAGAVQGHYGVDPHRNFEFLVPRGDAAVGYWRDNSRAGLPTRPGGVATWGGGAVRAVALCSTSRGDGWLQALTQEDTSIYHLYRCPLEGGFRWMRSACIRLDDLAGADDSDVPLSRKLAQVTGEVDIQAGGPSLSTSLSSAGIRGTDLGVTVEHGRRRFALFGDTHWIDPSRVTRDSIAEIHGTTDGRLPRFEFHGSQLEIVGGPVTQLEYDVPLDAFSVAGQLFVFFSSDHFSDGKVMGRSVLTRALDPAMPISGDARERPIRFQLLTTLSDFRYINVSVQLADAAVIPGLGRRGRVLLIWGSGAYRADDLRLAYLDLRDPAIWSYLLDDRPFDASLLGLRYFSGLCGQIPLWSGQERDARPLFSPSALGEISVRWIRELGQYVMLTMSGPEDPIGMKVIMRTAPAPWGPWSKRRVVFDWILDGLGYRTGSTPFIHRANTNDSLGDCIFTQQCTSGGAAYAPYLLDIINQPGHMTIRYLLSTWNPYQSMLMAHDLPQRHAIGPLADREPHVAHSELV